MNTAAWLAGILTTGELFLWNKDQDYLKIVPAIEESKKVVAAAQGTFFSIHPVEKWNKGKAVFLSLKLLSK